MSCGLNFSCVLSNPPDTKPGVVYCLRSPSNKFYVGVTERCFADRAAEHVKESKRKNPTRAISKAIAKYGADSIAVAVICDGVDSEVLYKEEVSWIKKLASYGGGYNLTEGGEGTRGWFEAVSSEKQAAISSRAKAVIDKLWMDEGFRKKIVDGNRKRADSDSFKNAARCRMAKLNADPVFKEKCKRVLSEVKKTSAYREKFLESVATRSKNKEWVVAQGKRLRSYYENPENVRKSLERLAEMNADKDFQKRRLDAVRRVCSSDEWLRKNAEKNAAMAKIKPDSYQKVYEDYVGGVPVKQIAMKFGVGRQTIYNVIGKLKKAETRP